MCRISDVDSKSNNEMFLKILILTLLLSFLPTRIFYFNTFIILFFSGGEGEQHFVKFLVEIGLLEK